MKKIRVLSGIRASYSSLHIGNLLGAIDKMIKLQEDPKYETFYMVADLHAITTDFDPNELKKYRIEVAKDYLACGIDPNKSTLFLQADVHEHLELAYYLSSVISVKRLYLVPAFKDKKKDYKNHLERMSLALLDYPVLMAADILLYKAEVVPIGVDQLPHLEVAREIVRKMNLKYKLNLPKPQARYNDINAIPNILGTGEKMSKSEPEGAIFLNDSLDVIKRKISKIPTLTAGGEKIPEKGGVYTLYLLTKLFVPEKINQFENEFFNGTIRYSEKKGDVSEAIFNRLKPIQEKRRHLNDDIVIGILKTGAEKAKIIARETLKEVKEKMGLL